MAEILNCFPLTVFKEKAGLDSVFRRRVGDMILEAHKTGPKAGESRSSAWTGDRNGFERLHERPELSPMFKAFHRCLLAYARALSINSEKIDFHVTRAWGTVTRAGQSIRRHRHNQSHVSIVYYPVKTDGTGNLVFHAPDPFNELAPGMFENHARAMGLLTGSDILNSELVNLPVAEDDVVIFPSKTYHGTEVNEAGDVRVSIAVDVLLSLKDSSGVEYLLPPVEQWRKTSGF